MFTKYMHVAELRLLIGSGGIKFSQYTISDHTREGVYIGKLAENMTACGWIGPAVNAVELADKTLILLDHRRILAALLSESGKLRVEVAVYNENEKISGKLARAYRIRKEPKAVVAVRRRMYGRDFSLQSTADKDLGLSPHEVTIIRVNDIFDESTQQEVEENLQTLGFQIQTTKETGSPTESEPHLF